MIVPYSQIVEQMAYRMVGSLPVLIVLFVGGVLCLKRAWRHPRACMLTGIAILIAFGSYTVMPIITMLMSQVFGFRSGDVGIHFWMIMHQLIYSIPVCAMWILLLVVIFGREGYSGDRSLVWKDDEQQGPDSETNGKMPTP
jgi:hypothetical protein